MTCGSGLYTVPWRWKKYCRSENEIKEFENNFYSI